MAIDIYTTGNMAAAVVDSITSEATGYPKENLIDNNPDTSWKPTATGSVTWDIDLQSAKEVDAIILWVQNYTTDFSGPTVYLTVSSSPDDSTYTQRYSQYYVNPTTRPISVSDISGNHTYRYWRISLSSLPSVIQLSACWLCRKFSLTKSHNIPNHDTTIYHNQVTYGAGGRMFASAINSQPSKQLPREYHLGSTDYGYINSAFTDSGGRLRPVVIYENSTYYGVYFDSDKLNENEFASDFYNPTIGFVQIPYIPDGATY